MNQATKPKLETILKHLPFKYFVIDASSLVIVDTNDSTLFTGKPCYSQIYDVDKPCSTKGVKCACCVINKDILYKDNYQIIDGLLCKDESLSEPIYDDHGKLTHFLVQRSNFNPLLVEPVSSYPNYSKKESSVYANLIHAVSIFDNKGKILFANELATKNISNNTDSIIGENIKKFMSPKQSEVFLRLIKKTEASNKILQQNLPNHFTDQVKWFSNAMRPIVFGPKLNSAILSISQDITESVLSHEKIIRSETNFKAIAENISDVIWKLNINTLEYNYMSPSIYALRGITVEEALQEGLANSVHPEDFKSLKNAISQIQNPNSNKILSKINNKFEIRQYHKDGSLKWVEISFSIIHNSDNVPVEILGVSRDITKNRWKKEKLVKSLGIEKFFADIIRNSAQAICITYPNGKGILLNKSAFNLFGYTDSEISKLNWNSDLSPSKWHQLEKEHLTKSIKTKSSVSYEKEIITKNGEIIPVEVSIHPNFNSDGILDHYISFINNISKRHKTQELLTVSEERLKFAQKASNDGLWDWNVKTDHLYMSPLYLKMLGYSEGDIEQSFDTFKKLVHPDDLPSVFIEHFKYLDGLVSRFETKFRMRHQDGHWVPILSRSYKILDSKGELQRIVGTHIDLTEIENMQSILKESEERYKTLFESTNVGICTSTFNGDLIRANSQLLKILGLNEHNYKSTNIRNFYLNPDDRTQFIKEIKEKKQISNFHIQLINKKGKSKWVSLSSKIQIIKQEKLLISVIMDISKQVEAEQHLLESQERFKILTDVTIEGILIHNNGITIDANQALLNMLECKLEDVMGKNIIQLYGTQETLPIYFEKVKSNSTKTYQAEIKTSSGKVIPVDVTGRSAKINGKEVRVTSIRDISDRLEAQKQINKLSAVVEQSANSVIITNTRGEIEYINSMFTKLTGYTFDEVLGKNPRIVKSGQTPDSIYRTLWKTISKGKVWSGELMNKSKNGKHFWINSTITPLKDSKGNITHYVGINLDITERIKDHQKMDDLSNRLQMAIKAANFGVWDINLDSMEIYWDEKMYEIYELGTKNKDKFKYFKSVVNQDDLKEYTKKVSNGFRKDELIEMELRICPNNHKKYIKNLLMFIPASGNQNFNRLIGITYEITKQKLFEQELINERKKAEENDNLKSAFLANMSHEIRTPLNGIIGFTEILQDTEAAYTPEETKSFLKIVEKNGQILLHLVNDIIDLSKIETGQLQINSEDIDVQKSILSTLDIFSQQAEQKGLLLLIDFPQHSITLNTDSSRIEQIFINLIGNAIKFTDTGYIKIGSIDKDEQVLFFVEDTGCGINKKMHHIIFERFSQGKPIRDQLLGGTGLGLAITRGLVELLGGKIWIESEENKGSTFFFTIPKK